MCPSGSDPRKLAASIDARDVSLVVPYYAQVEQAPSSSWRATLFGAATSVPRRRFATLLDELTFKVAEGERIALIGRNGAGKSTLLRVLAGAFEPTGGSLRVKGSRHALLSIGLGFKNEATVRENIYLRASAMGVPSSDIRELVDPVLEFSGLKEVENRRLLTLSSGQRMRLGFAVSTINQHDILLMDEWLGTGDAEFVRRARERMMDRVRGSKILVIASHSRPLLSSLCTRGILLEQGKIVFDGSVDDAFAEYAKLQPEIGGKAAAARKMRRRERRRIEKVVRKELTPKIRAQVKAELLAAREDEGQ